MDSNTRANVYIVSFNPEHDYSDALKFGEIIYMTRGYIIGQETPTILRTFSSYAEIATEQDYLLLSGPNLLCSLATAAWLQVRGTVNLLNMTPVRDKVAQTTAHVYQIHHVPSQEVKEAGT